MTPSKQEKADGDGTGTVDASRAASSSAPETPRAPHNYFNCGNADCVMEDGECCSECPNWMSKPAPKEPETPRALKTCQNCADKKCKGGHHWSEGDCPTWEPAPKEPDRKPYDPATAYPEHPDRPNSYEPKEPDKSLFIIDDVCKNCNLLVTCGGNISNCPNKPKEPDKIDWKRIARDLGKVIERQNAEIYALTQKLAATEKGFTELEKSWFILANKVKDLEAKLKKKDDGLKKIKRWSEHNLELDAQEIINESIDELLKDAPKKS
jgi:hypothetical protein